MKCRVEDIVNASEILEEAKYQKLGDEDKIKLWKISRAFSPITKKYKEDFDDAQKKLIPSEDFFEDIQKALSYQKMLDEGKKEGLPLTKEEHQRIAKEWNDYNSLVKKAEDELKNKEEELDIQPLSEEAFGNLMAGNDWTLKQVKALEFLVES